MGDHRTEIVRLRRRHGTAGDQSMAVSWLTDPHAYAEDSLFDQRLTFLRTNQPVIWVTSQDYPPFWAVTRHADILTVQRDAELFINRPRFRLYTNGIEQMLESLFATGVSPHLLQLDGQRHRQLRAVGAGWFRPRHIRTFTRGLDELAHLSVDRMREIGPACDFVTEVATRFPLKALMLLLGLPDSDFDLLQSLTQQIFGSDDEEYRRGPEITDLRDVFADLSRYFIGVMRSRRAHPTSDLASAIANARIDGELLPETEVNAYYFIIATAGHDTTRHAISGGLRALIQHPGELDRLQRDPSLLGTAIEEMLRWSTPAKEGMRTATTDTRLGDVDVAAGESVYLSLPSGNRDPDVFDDPFHFDVTRTPNRHLSFGHGAHFCLGAPLARMYMDSFFTALLPRLHHIELAGPPESMATVFVGGLKHLPVRYILR